MAENNAAERRHELGMTLEQLSKKSNVPVSTLGEVEKGSKKTLPNALIKARNNKWHKEKRVIYWTGHVVR